MDASLTELLPRLFLSMAVVLVVMWVAARVMKDRRLPGMGSPSARVEAKRNEIEVLGRQGVGKNATVSVVRTGDKTLVLGITDHQITLLTELHAASDIAPLHLVSDSETQRTGLVAVPALPASDQAWKGLLEQVREKTVRRA